MNDNKRNNERKLRGISSARASFLDHF